MKAIKKPENSIVLLQKEIREATLKNQKLLATNQADSYINIFNFFKKRNQILIQEIPKM